MLNKACISSKEWIRPLLLGILTGESPALIEARNKFIPNSYRSHYPTLIWNWLVEYLKELKACRFHVLLIQVANHLHMI